MPVPCPHCSEPVEGVVTEASLKERLERQDRSHADALKAKDGEIGLLRDEVKTLKPRVEGYEAIVVERDTLKADLEKERESVTRERALMPILAGIEDEDKRAKVRETFDLLYQSAMSGKEGEDRVPFGELDKWAQDHPVLERFFAAPQDPAPPSAPATTTKPESGLPRPAPAEQPDQSAKLSVQDVRAYFASAEYRSLPSEERRAKRAELQQQVAEQRAPAA